MSEKKFILSLVILVFVGLLFVGYGRFVERITIESARLVEVTENGYKIAFSGNVHNYTFD